MIIEGYEEPPKMVTSHPAQRKSKVVTFLEMLYLTRGMYKTFFFLFDNEIIGKYDGRNCREVTR